MVVSKKEKQFSGGCSCGAIRYHSSEKPEFQLICQCRQCQRITGSGHAPSIAFKKEAFALTGDLAFFDTQADDGNTVRHGFCPGCGNPLLNMPLAHTDKIFILVGSLDDPSSFKPDFVVYSAMGYEWDAVDSELKRY